ncbi:MAG: thiamine phosphate synthase [Myxococcota bacterium]
MTPPLLAITPPAGPVSTSLVEASIRSGVPVAVLLREPGASPQGLLDPRGRLAALRRAAADAGLCVLLSVDPARAEDGVAAACDAGLHGVQLRGDASPDVVRRVRQAWPGGVVGRSVHGAPGSEPEPADYVVFAPVFPPKTPAAFEKRAVGIEALAPWTASGRRVYALGGISVETAPACIAAGAFGVAGISTFLGSVDAVADTLAALAAVVAHARHVPPRD